MSSPRLGLGLSAAGLLALLAAVAWWWLVYGRVVNGDYLTYRDAAPCLLRSSDLCTLAEALCRNDHVLGIKRYSAALLWAGLALTGVGLVVTAGRKD